MSIKEKWGNACWFLFHTAAVKLKDDREDIIPKLLNIIFNISNNLPCPDCTEHARETLKRLKIDKITTKDSFIVFLHQFHNIVNIRAGNPQFSKEDHDKKYKYAHLGNILKNFVYVMSDNYPTNNNNLMNDMNRKRVVKNVAIFFANNADAFDQAICSETS